MAKAKGKTKVKKAPVVEREVLYPDDLAEFCRGEHALTQERITEMLGWTEEPEGQDWKEDYLLKDMYGKKVRCTRNPRNRPFDLNKAKELAWEHLNRKWRYNGEPILLSRYGDLLNGQHTLISAKLAEQERTRPNVSHWERFWTGPVTVEKVVIYGVPDDDETVDTMDTCKPRSLADVIYRSPFFAGKSHKERVNCSKYLEQAVRMVWDRIGVGLNAFDPYFSHSEAINFINRHPRIIEAVTHVLQENSEGSISLHYISLGYAAGLLYLMGTADSDPEKYRGATLPDESKLVFTSWDKACEYWVALSQQSKDVVEVFRRLKRFADPETGEGKPTRDERCAVLAKGWARFSLGKKVREGDVKIHRPLNQHGYRVLKERPLFGGIDVGGQRDDENALPNEVPDDIMEDVNNWEDVSKEEPSPSPEEIERERDVVHERASREDHLKKLNDNRVKKGMKPILDDEEGSSSNEEEDSEEIEIEVNGEEDDSAKEEEEITYDLEEEESVEPR